MTAILKVLSGVGAAIVAFLAIFMMGKRSGKQETENEQRKKIIKGIEERNKINADVSNLTDTALDDELRDKDTRQ